MREPVRHDPPWSTVAHYSPRKSYSATLRSRRVVAAQSAPKVADLIEAVEDPEDQRVPTLAREALGSLIDQFRMVEAQLLGLEKKLMVWHRANEASCWLETVQGVRVITATDLVATIGDASQFHSGRQLAAWLGLVPRQYSSGGKEQLGWWCQAKANQSPKCVTSGFSGRDLTPFGERGGMVLLENIAAV